MVIQNPVILTIKISMVATARISPQCHCAWIWPNFGSPAGKTALKTQVQVHSSGEEDTIWRQLMVKAHPYCHAQVATVPRKLHSKHAKEEGSHLLTVVWGACWGAPCVCICVWGGCVCARACAWLGRLCSVKAVDVQLWRPEFRSSGCKSWPPVLPALEHGDRIPRVGRRVRLNVSISSVFHWESLP